MSYNSIVEMVSNRALLGRIAAAAAVRGISDPEGWTRSKAYLFVTQPGWAEAWERALTESAPASPATPDTPDVAATRRPPVAATRRPPSIVDQLLTRRSSDPGAREDVITDQMIADALAAVEAHTAPRVVVT